MQILVVEDDPKVTLTLRRDLAQGGHSVVVCKSTDPISLRARDSGCEVILFEMPGLDPGQLDRIRDVSKAMPVVCLLGTSNVSDRITALNAGADDCLGRPYDGGELVARIGALQRRIVNAGGVRKLGSTVLDARRHALIGSEGETRLTSREYALLAHLADRLGEPVSRSSILEHVWGTQFVGEGNVVDVYIGYLRSKLRQAAAEQVRIEAVRRVGYRLIATS